MTFNADNSDIRAPRDLHQTVCLSTTPICSHANYKDVNIPGFKAPATTNARSQMSPLSLQDPNMTDASLSIQTLNRRHRVPQNTISTAMSSMYPSRHQQIPSSREMNYEPIIASVAIVT